MRKVELDRSDFWTNMGTFKGLAEMAIRIRREFLPDRPCPVSIGGFFDALVERPSGKAFVESFSGSREAMKEEAHQIHSLMRWVDSGLPAFDLTHGLMSALLLTDPSDVSCEMIRSPFHTFAIRFPDGFWEMHGNLDGVTSASIGIVHYFEAFTAEPPYTIRPMLSLRIVAKNGSTSTWETYEPPRGDGVAAPWLEMDLPVAEDPSGQLVTPNEHDRRIAIAFRRLFVNLCLYVAENGRGEQLGRRPQAGRGSSGPSSSPDVWVLGREVKLDRNLMDAAKAWTDSKSPRKSAHEGWRLRERFTVRGHWRNQAHGPGRVLRTMKWIAPYWKGDGPTFQHVYKP